MKTILATVYLVVDKANEYGEHIGITAYATKERAIHAAYNLILERWDVADGLPKSDMEAAIVDDENIAVRCLEILK